MLATRYESLTSEWLNSRQIEFDFWSSLAGNRPDFGGVKADFILLNEGVVWRLLPETPIAKDSLDKTILENIGYAVVNIVESNLDLDIDATLTAAVAGEEIDNALYTVETVVMSPVTAGMKPTGLGDKVGNIPSSHVAPISSALDASNILATSATINGVLIYDGGMFCDCRFDWGTAKTDSTSLCWICPFDWINFLYLNSPEISYDFATVDSYANQTNWQSNKLTDDTFSEGITGLTSGQHYNYRTWAKNYNYLVQGYDKIFLASG